MKKILECISRVSCKRYSNIYTYVWNIVASSSPMFHKKILEYISRVSFKRWIYILTSFAIETKLEAKARVSCQRYWNIHPAFHWNAGFSWQIFACFVLYEYIYFWHETRALASSFVSRAKDIRIYIHLLNETQDFHICIYM